jgi:hypothetical protein
MTDPKLRCATIESEFLAFVEALQYLFTKSLYFSQKLVFLLANITSES